jgi:CarD family transcriptional regulator
MTFQVGEKVVYPNHGVATIENISSRAFAGQFERFYLLRLTYYNRLTVMVPFSHVEELRLRKLTRNGEVARVMDFLTEGRCRRYLDWKDRFKENAERMRHGSLLGVAQVLKSLLILQAEKALSFREKRSVSSCNLEDFAASLIIPTRSEDESFQALEDLSIRSGSRCR